VLVNENAYLTICKASSKVEAALGYMSNIKLDTPSMHICEEKQTDLVAKSTRRLADCYFMQKEYDKALECYEKALSMFRNTSSLGRDLVLENAHVKHIDTHLW
jgi:tetratricopeptide (TPR) repeat protein